MLKKLRLKRSDNYDCHVATYHMARMVVEYIKCEEHPLSLGSEQGLDHWDDLVIENNDGSLKYLQVKRQTSNFSAYKTTRGNKTKGDEEGKPQDLSALDDAFKALSSFYEIIAKHALCTKTFTLVLPYGNIEIKKGLDVKSLSELCEECRKSSATANGLKTRADGKTKQIIEWMKSWCGFQSIDQIFFVLRKITVELLGDERSVNDLTELALSQCFDKANEVRTKIYNHLHLNATDIGAVCPKHITPLVIQHLKNRQPFWAFYQQQKGYVGWNVDGLNFGRGFEPSSYVDALWNDGSNDSVLIVNNSVEFTKKLLTNNPLIRSLFRLALHLPRTSTAEFPNANIGLEVARSAINGTFGTAKNDFGKGGITWRDGIRSLASTSTRVLTDSDDMEVEARHLSEKMYEFTWQAIIDSVNARLGDLTGGLGSATQSLWNSWVVNLNSSLADRNKFLENILSIHAEPKTIVTELRIGLSTVDLVAESIWFLLIVSVALGGSHAKWDSINTDLETKLVGLRYWGGNDNEGLVREMFTEDKEEVTESIIGGEVKPVLVLPHIKSSVNEIYCSTLADDSISANSLASPKRPKLLVTKTVKLTRLINDGDILGIREELEKSLRAHQESRNKSIKNFGSGDLA
ncbi:MULTISPECIES: ABC-three component system protein [unclassified Pseudomonas]|uniref:ABC-three component system protein n=1 Tax=unclassified Pseudomonas TaxID=196821 RepID=UPI0011AF5673|nr:MULTISPECIES: ABC-three component system protein [unclassified Pseudomonas]